MTSEITYNTSVTGLYKVKIYGSGGANNATACYTLKVQLSSTPFRLGSFDNSTTADAESNLTVEGISIYPNPAKDILNVLIPASENTAAKIFVVDQTGREVTFFNVEKSTASNHIQFDLLRSL